MVTATMKLKDAEKDNGHGVVNAPLLPYALSVKNGDTALGAILSPCAIFADSANLLATAINGNKEYPLSVILNFGKGTISLIGFDIGSQYLDYRQTSHRLLIKNIAERAYEPKARIERALGNAEIVCLEKDGKLMLQIINANGSHADPTSMSEDVIPPLVDLEMSVMTENKNAKATLLPANRPLDCRYESGRIYFTVDRVDIHSIVKIDE